MTMQITGGDAKEVLRITRDRKVIVAGDIHEAARAFWDTVAQMAAEKGMTFEVDKPSYRERQEAQLAEWQRWVNEQGKDGKPPLELPVTLDTLLRPAQLDRMSWLRQNVIGRILEVGCSWGFVSAYIDGDAGIDLNPANIALAKLLAPSREFCVADARHLPVADKSFHTVVLAEILEHLTWPGDVFLAIEEGLRVAQQRVLITLPAEDTQEAGSKKHAWVATHVEEMKIMEIAWEREFRRQAVNHTHAPGFICIRLEMVP